MTGLAHDPYERLPCVQQVVTSHLLFRIILQCAAVFQPRVPFLFRGTRNILSTDLKNKIEFEDEVYTTTGFCKKFMPPEKRNSKDAYQGPKYFMFKGELLTDLRAKLGK